MTGYENFTKSWINHYFENFIKQIILMVKKMNSKIALV